MNADSLKAGRAAARKLELLLPFGLFLFLAGDNLREFFGGDDVMNLYQYLQRPFSHWAAGILHFWSSAWYRPLGGIVYLVLWKLFGLHALPYKLLLFVLIIFNMTLYLSVARRLSGSVHVASWSLLLCAYHAALNGLYLDFGTIYDVLGYSFFFGAIAAYIAWVSTYRRPIAGSTLIVSFYVLGLCCKEVVVTLPAVLLAYSLLMTDAGSEQRWRWLFRSGLSIVVCFLFALWYSIGKMSGPDSLARDPLYAPHFSLHQYALTTASYMHQLFYLSGRFPTNTEALWVLGLMAAAALLLRSRLMLFSVCAIVLTQLPVSFIAVRGAFAIYIATGFWALYIATLVHTAVRPRRKPTFSLAAYCCVAALLCGAHLRMKPRYDAHYTQQTRAYRNLVDHLAAWNFHIPADGKVLLLNDPFPADWVPFDSLFLISLYAHTTHATVNRIKFSSVMTPLTELNSYAYVIDYDAEWRLLKSPSQPLKNQARLQEIAGHAPILLLDGFDLPSPDNWRAVNSTFAMRVKTEDSPHLLHVALAALSPANVAASVDDGAPLIQTAGKPGNVEFAIPIPAEPVETSHTVRFQVTGADARVLFMSADLRSSP